MHAATMLNKPVTMAMQSPKQFVLPLEMWLLYASAQACCRSGTSVLSDTAVWPYLSIASWFGCVKSS